MRMQAGQDYEVIFNWANKGVAPIYRDVSVSLAVLDASNQVVHQMWLDGMNPKNWLPKSVTEQKATINLKELADGEYKIAVALFADKNDSQPAYGIGNKGRLDNGYYVIADNVQKSGNTFTLPDTQQRPISVVIDDVEQVYDQPPVMINDRTLVPIRFVSEALDAQVDWDQETATVIIKTADGAAAPGADITLPEVETGPNLLTNNSFEDDMMGWQAYGRTSLDLDTQTVQDGNKSMKVYERENPYTGPFQSITNILTENGPGEYHFSAWLKSPQEDASIRLVIVIEDDNGQNHFSQAAVVEGGGDFVQAAATKELSWTGTIKDAKIYTETNEGTGDYYVDNIVLAKVGGSAGTAGTQGGSTNAGTSPDSKYNASREWTDDSGVLRKAENAFDGDADTSWVSDYDSAGSWVEMTLDEETTFSQVFVQEYKVERVQAFKIQYLDGTEWKDAYEGKTIGTDGITVKFNPVTSTKIRFLVTQQTGWPSIAEVQIVK